MITFIMMVTKMTIMKILIISFMNNEQQMFNFHACNDDVNNHCDQLC